MKIKIEIDTDNAAFGESAEERADEVAAILYRLRQQIEAQGLYSVSVRDSNGNTVGALTIDGEG